MRVRSGLGIAVLSTLVVLAGAVGLLLLVGWLLLGKPPVPRTFSTSEWLDALKLGLALAAGVGAAIGITVSYRRQSTEEGRHSLEQRRYLNDRFAAAANLIGDVKAATRLAGVHALSQLADDWPEKRQMCIDVLCAYVRLPLDLSESADESEVRRSVFSSIRERLLPNSAVSWNDCTFDFTGASLTGADFSHIRLGGATLRFTRTIISNAVISFAGANLDAGLVTFSGAHLSHSRLVFVNSSVGAAEIRMAGLTLADESHVTMGGTRLLTGQISLRGALLSSGSITTHGLTQEGGVIDLSGAKIDGALLSFSGLVGLGGQILLDRTWIESGTVSFSGCDLRGLIVDVQNLHMDGGSLLFANFLGQAGSVQMSSASARLADVVVDPGELGKSILISP